MKKVRFVMVGGFLGAGKTTTMARLAKIYKERGHEVGIVTNDQASDLVDSNFLRSQGYKVGEVSGSCFCCNFNQLIRVVEKLEEEARPDVILAEPVGSCTDLVATVVQPLLRLYSHKFEVAPYAVLLKPGQGRQILKHKRQAGFSPSTAYIFRKQIEEADVILLNRIDELRPEDVEELAVLIEAEEPSIPVLRVSAKTGEGFDALVEFLDQKGEFGRRILDLDYDVYAEGEAELGWLNSSLIFSAPEAFALDDLLIEIVTRLRDSLAREGAETAHLKTIGFWERFSGVANLIGGEADPELSLASRGQVREVNLIVNARVAMDPKSLEDHVRSALARACEARRGRAEFLKTQSFRPGRPMPTHRYSDAL